ncbi:MAG: cytochrome c oxidase accessory protein CcoG [Betaproteobacteria bacterium RIFCSPLOWO2_02_FULL_65_24]|nr:MAG: cytochrome c oxidase accessory protein CcoG [Betaproteobacteria bacterium RIFCSPLOWO2_02_FULL_65_24]
MTPLGSPQPRAAEKRARKEPTQAVKPVEVYSAPLYEVRRKIYPRAVSGWFARWRVALVLLTQVIYYGVPWVSWNGRQAVLFDLAGRKFYIFGLVLWPQDFIYLTLLLVVSALALFLFTAVAGRLWCGYACPQTVYTEIFMWIERRVEGDRVRRMKLDSQPFGLRKLARKGTKQALWIAIALWTGFTFVGYFTPILELVHEVATFTMGPWETFWVLFYGFATCGNAAALREQVCLYMCPYARFQSAMFDSDTMTITYDAARGEPRGSRSRAANRRMLGLGDCVDCGICVQVCPTGIDIRDGLQYECIGCAACIDACNQVMKKMAYPPGLIRYATENALREGWSFGQMLRRVLRARVLGYAAVLAAVIAGSILALYLRQPLKVDVIRDRTALSREVQGGLIENVYRIQIMNTRETARELSIEARGLPSLHAAGETVVRVAAATTVMVPLKLRVDPAQAPAGSHKIEVLVKSLDDEGLAVSERSMFLVR